jgi:hypothetical protein
MASRHHQTPRKNDAAVDRMRGSIREFEFKIPAQARRDGEVVDGICCSKRPRRLPSKPISLCGDLLVW